MILLNSYSFPAATKMTWGTKQSFLVTINSFLKLCARVSNKLTLKQADLLIISFILVDLNVLRSQPVLQGSEQKCYR